MKTIQIFIGKFPRTESGRYYQPEGADGKPLAEHLPGSRKDIRESVVAARKAMGDWSNREAFNRGRSSTASAKMLEGRSAQFVHELMLQGATKKQAEARKRRHRLLDYYMRLVRQASGDLQQCEPHQQLAL
ncbi:MAG: aldehyde dehydrogenase family protein [Flavobacteriales bacterium]|nr:aldehyde dehydrogenase family protein [Flavobacteriales bacterium]